MKGSSTYCCSVCVASHQRAVACVRATDMRELESCTRSAGRAGWPPCQLGFTCLPGTTNDELQMVMVISNSTRQSNQQLVSSKLQRISKAKRALKVRLARCGAIFSSKDRIHDKSIYMYMIRAGFLRKFVSAISKQLRMRKLKQGMNESD